MQEEPGESRAEGMCDWDMVSGAEKEMMNKLEKMRGCGRRRNCMVGVAAVSLNKYTYGCSRSIICSITEAGLKGWKKEVS